MNHLQILAVLLLLLSYIQTLRLFYCLQDYSNLHIVFRKINQKVRHLMNTRLNNININKYKSPERAIINDGQRSSNSGINNINKKSIKALKGR